MIFEKMCAPCPDCAKADVCKFIEEPGKCRHFLNAMNHTRYGNIYDMFQPIFSWLQTHYPSHEAKFIVDHNSAKMYLEHGPAVFDKSINSSVESGKELTEFLMKKENDHERENQETE